MRLKPKQRHVMFLVQSFRNYIQHSLFRLHNAQTRITAFQEMIQYDVPSEGTNQIRLCDLMGLNLPSSQNVNVVALSRIFGDATNSYKFERYRPLIVVTPYPSDS